jgi:hypothetical protein
MIAAEAFRRRQLAGKIGTLFIILFFAGAMDGVLSTFRQPANTLEVLPGTSHKISGSLPEKVASLNDIEYTSASDDIRLTIEAIGTGFWLGGDMWRGLLSIGPETAPGDYTLKVAPKGKEYPKPLPEFRIKVYEDAQHHQQASKSLIKKYLGLSPWMIAAFFLPLTFLTFGAVYYMSHKIERLMAAEGKAIVYMVRPGDAGGYEIAFALGSRHGVRPGDRLTLLDGKEATVGDIEVSKVSETDSIAYVGSDSDIKPGYIVRRTLG